MCRKGTSTGHHCRPSNGGGEQRRVLQSCVPKDKLYTATLLTRKTYFREDVLMRSLTWNTDYYVYYHVVLHRPQHVKRLCVCVGV